MDITKSLPGLLGNITRNRQQVEVNLKQCRVAVSQLDEASIAAIKQLLKKFEHAQSVNQFVASYVQLESLEVAAREMDAAIAVLQTAMDDDTFAVQAQAQADSNERISNNPLPSAGQADSSAPADQTNESAHVEADAPAAEEPDRARDASKTIHSRNRSAHKEAL
ncbi:MAG TPA: hypothetical protein VIJ38_13620 [Acidobacteriaceae bacterium]